MFIYQTLGISWYEGILVDAIPMVPDRLSYSEMAGEDYVYPSRWTSSWQNYQNMKSDLQKFIKDKMDNYELYHNQLGDQRSRMDDFFSGEELYCSIKNRK